MTSPKQSVLARVDSLGDEMLPFLPRLIAIPTVNWFEVAAHGRIAHEVCPFQASMPISKMAGFLSAIESQLKPLLAQRHTAMPVEPPAAHAPA